MPETTPCVNGDLSVRCTADTRIMAYSPSPSGTERQHTVLQHGDLAWQSTAIAGVSRKPLYQQDGFSDVTCLEWWDLGTKLPCYEYEEGAELFVLKDRFTDENGFYDEGSWLRMPKGSKHTPHTAEGCTLYIKRGGFAYLREEAPA